MRNALCPSVVASLSEVTKVRAVISHLQVPGTGCGARWGQRLSAWPGVREGGQGVEDAVFLLDTLGLSCLWDRCPPSGVTHGS